MISSYNSSFNNLSLEEYGLFYFESTELSTSSDEDILTDDDIKTDNINLKKIDINVKIDSFNTLGYDNNTNNYNI